MLKTVDEIYEEMCASFAGRAGFELNCGGEMAIRLYAMAAQVQALYIYADWVKKQCFPQTAENEYLDRHGKMRGLTRNAAVKAEGTIRFYIPEILETDTQIPAGSVCMTADSAEFITVNDAKIPAGRLYADVPAEAKTAGNAGNVQAGTVTVITAPPVGVTGCTNIDAFRGGADAESDEEFRERIIASFNKLPNGANTAYYEKAALDVDGVAAVSVVPRARGTGTVDVYISSETGMPSAALITEVGNMLDAAREICVDVDVFAPETVEVPVSVKLKTASGYVFEDVKEAVESTVREYFSGERLGENILCAKLGSLVFGTDGVENYLLAEPLQDLTVGADELPVLGTLTVTEMA